MTEVETVQKRLGVEAGLSDSTSHTGNKAGEGYKIHDPQSLCRLKDEGGSLCAD